MIRRTFLYLSASRCVAILFLTTHCVFGAVLAHEEFQSVSFERDIRPVLKAHCFHCHGEDGASEADIDLRRRKRSISTIIT